MKKLFTIGLAAICIIGYTKTNAQTGIITTIMGNGVGGYSGDGGQATDAEVFLVYGIAMDNSGNILLDDWGNHRVREISKSSGIISTIGGNGVVGYSGDGGQATAAEIHSPYGMALDGAGNIYVNDEVDNAIRKITASTGIITTIAGMGGIGGFYGDGGQATAAEINNPHEGIAFDTHGNLFFGDYGNNCIRKISTTGVISTIAGIGGALNYGYYGDGGQATAAELYGPAGITFDASGNLYIADQQNNVIRKIDMTSGIITTAAGNGTAGYFGDGGQATAAELNDCSFIAIGSHGNISIADDNNNVVREINITNGIITTVAGNGAYGFYGDGGQATAAEMQHTNLLLLPPAGGLIIGDDENYRFREIVDVSAVNNIQNTTDNITLYPNPANNVVFITSANKIAAGTIITMFDITGKEVWAKNIINSSESLSINTSGLSNGLYMLRFTSSDKSSVTKKLMIAK